MAMQQQSVRFSVAGLMARQPTAAEVGLIKSGRPTDLQEALARLPARKGGHR